MSTRGDATAAAPDAHTDPDNHDLLGLGHNTSSRDLASIEPPKTQGHDRNESGSGSIYCDASGIGESSHGVSEETVTRSQHDSGSEEGGVKLKGKKASNAELGEAAQAVDADMSSIPRPSRTVQVLDEGQDPGSEATHQLSRQERSMQLRTSVRPGGDFHPNPYRLPPARSNPSPTPDNSGRDSTSSAATQIATTMLPSFGAQGNTEEDRRNWERIQALGDASAGRYAGDIATFPEYPSQDPSRPAQKRKERTGEDSRDLDGSPSITSTQRSSRPPPYDVSYASTPRVPQSQGRQREAQQSRTEVVVPRWQPDAAVTICPICGTQFSFFVRKHHCRKCGRVVCNACSPHRITIPYQFIVQPPTESDTLNPHSSRARPALDPARAGSSSEFENLGGGERVRLCNPCVPDPNTAPPQTPTFDNQPQSIPRSTHGRSASSVNNTFAASPQPTLSSSNPSQRVMYDLGNTRRRPREPSILGRRPSNQSNSTDPRVASNTRPNIGNNGYPGQAYADYRTRSSTVTGSAVRPDQNPTRPTVPGPSVVRPFVPRVEHQTRPLPRIPRPPRIAEEDECPVCHQELPSSQLPNSDALRAAHITNCIETAMQGTTSTPPSPPPTTSSDIVSQARELYGPSSSSVPPTPVPIANTPEARMAAREQAHAAVVLGQHSSATPAFRRTGVFPYKATEKDCVDDAECTICLEEFEVGQDMGRLECFCRFHLHCIREWFVNHYGQCPVHHQAY